MKRRIILAFVLVFALSAVFAGCTARKPGTGTNNGTANRFTGTGINNGTGNYTGIGSNSGGGFNTGTNNGTGTGNMNFKDNTGTGNFFGTSPYSGTGLNTGTGTGTNTGNNTGFNTNNNTGLNAGNRFTGNNMGGNTTTAPNSLGTGAYSGMGTGTGTAITQADNISRAVQTVPGVRNATVVISGRNAYVGIDTTGAGVPNGTNSIATIKRSVARKVSDTDSSIRVVYVSSDMSFMDRLRSVSDAVRSGRPISGFTSQLNRMTKGITPQRF